MLRSMSTPIYSAIRQICEEKGLEESLVIETIEVALAAAYRKDFGEPNQNVRVKFNPETGATKVWDVKTVVANEVKAAAEAAHAAAIAARAAAEAGGQPAPLLVQEAQKEDQKKEGEKEKEEEIRYSPKLHLSLDDAKAVKSDVKVGDEIKTDLSLPGEFGRMAAQTAKQVIIQKLREAERTTTFNEFKKREHEVVSGVVQRREGRVILIDIGRATGILLPDRQIEREEYRIGSRLNLYVESVTMTPRGPEIVLSRTHPDIVRRLFTVEIPEIANGSIDIRALTREAGARSKIAVEALDENIDPIGSCVGQRGTRIQTIIQELGGEKIDIITYNADPKKFIANALSPAKVQSITLEETEQRAVVVVNDDQLSLAIGKGGQNVRLAARLTGWKIDIRGSGAKDVAAAAVPEGKTADGAKASETKDVDPAPSSEPKRAAEAEAPKEEIPKEETPTEKQPKEEPVTPLTETTSNT